MHHLILFFNYCIKYLNIRCQIAPYFKTTLLQLLIFPNVTVLESYQTLENKPVWGYDLPNIRENKKKGMYLCQACNHVRQSLSNTIKYRYICADFLCQVSTNRTVWLKNFWTWSNKDHQISCLLWIKIFHELKNDKVPNYLKLVR